MKPSQRVNGQPASKNVVSPKPKIPISPKNTIKNKVGSTGDLFQVKSQQCIKSANSEISTVDLQSKESKLNIESEIQADKIDENEQKKSTVRANKPLLKKQQRMTSPKNPLPQKVPKLKKEETKKPSEIELKDLESKLQDKINQYEMKSIEYEKQIQQKDKTIQHLLTEKKQLEEQHQKLKKLNIQNKRIMKEKVMKFNEDGDENRKLKERITELEEEVEKLSKKSESRLLLNEELSSCKDKDSIIMELKQRIGDGSEDQISSEIQVLKDQNYELRKKLMNALQKKYDRKNDEHIKRKMDLLKSTDKILQITKQQKVFLQSLIPKY